MPELRVHNFAVSLDGYAAGPDQSRDDPLGVGGTRLAKAARSRTPPCSCIGALTAQRLAGPWTRKAPAWRTWWSKKAS